MRVAKGSCVPEYFSQHETSTPISTPPCIQEDLLVVWLTQPLHPFQKGVLEELSPGTRVIVHGIRVSS